MTDDASLEAAGDEAGGPLPAASAPGEDRREAPVAPRSIFDLRAVTPLSPAERAARAEAMERSLAFGAEPVRDERGWALEVDFIKANGEAVEPWKHDRRDKRLYKRNQKVTKAAGQLIGQPGDKIEWAKRLAVLHHRDGSDIEGAVRRGLFDAIWRYDHVYDGYTVPRRYGTHFMKTGRVAAVAEEQRRKWIAEGRAPADAFWVRNRRNTGLVLVSPNPDPDAAEKIFSEGGVEAVAGHADVEKAFEPHFPEDARLPLAEEPFAGSTDEQQARFNYPDIALAADSFQARSSEESDPEIATMPVINLSEDRIANILADDPAIFEVADSLKANSEEPWYALHTSGYWAVWVHQDLIDHESKAQGVDPSLVKAIMYVENAHGASYGWIPESVGKAKTILPMNISPETWGGLVDDGQDFGDALVNVRAGVRLIRRISERIENPTIARVASPYKFTGRELVSDYGARVAEVYATRAWERVPKGFADPELNKTPTRKAYLDDFRSRREEFKRRLAEPVPE